MHNFAGRNDRSKALHNNLLEKSRHSHFSVPRLSSLTFLRRLVKEHFPKEYQDTFTLSVKRKSQKSSNKQGRTGASLVQETKVNDTVSLQSRAQLPKTNFNRNAIFELDTKTVTKTSFSITLVGHIAAVYSPCELN